jgi:simple sugar transport system permease protein
MATVQSQAITLTRFRARLARSPEAVTLVSLLVLFAFFSASADQFLSPLSLSNIITFASIVGIIVVGVSMLMIAGEFDLSVGSNLAVASFVFALTLNAGVSPVLSMLVAVLVSTLLGLVNGLIVIGTGIPSFITTLGTMLAYRGIARAIGGGDFAKYTASKPVLFGILNGPLDLLNQLSDPVANLRVSVIWFVLIAVGMSFLLTRTRFGNWVFATGGNPEAARAQGVPVKRVKLAAFTMAGLLTGMASVMHFAHRTSVDPLRGQGWELICVAACVIGGVHLTGGVGAILGAGLGIILLQMLEQGLVLMGVSVQIFRAVAGGILILSVMLNVYLRKFE